MHPVLQEYQSRIDEIHGTMVRICFSLPAQRHNLQKLASDSGVPLNTPLSAGSFDPERADVIHTVTIHDQLRSLEDGGFDEVLIGNICASFIYSLWEDKYRSDFAKVRQVEKNVIKSEFFKELGTYRHAIVHNRALGTSKTEKLMLLPQVVKDEPVKVTRHVLELIVKRAKEELHAISLPEYAA